MIRALLWKEAREQGVIVGALAVLGLAVLIALGVLNPSTADGLDSRTALTNPGFLAVVMLTMTGGAVVGGTLFAAEKENGTSVYLAMLPVRRSGVWAGKLLAGAVLVLAVTAVLFAAAAAVGLLGRAEHLGLWAVGLPTLALATYGWASVGSVLSRSSLAAAGVGVVLMIGASAVVGPVMLFAFALVVRLLGAVLPLSNSLATELTVGAGVLCSLLALPGWLSYRLYTAPDRDRHRRAVQGKAAGKPGARRPSLFAPLGQFTAGARAAVWMNVRQQRKFTVVLVVIGLLSGLSLLAPPVPFVAVWPPVGLFQAVLVGVLGWYDEQSPGAKRFWLERRLPVGHLWWAKVLVGAGSCLLVSVVTLAPVAVKAWVTRREWESAPSFLMGEYDFPVGTFVLLWPAYGFAFGHLVGMLFRKAVVASSVALMVAAVAAAVWLPSLLGGGVWRWQVWLPLLPVMLTARALAWSCVADRVGTGRALGRLAAGGAVLAAAVAAGLVFRVVEIPDDPSRGAEKAFERDQIPPFDTNLAGQEYRRAGTLLHEAVYGRGALNEQLARKQVGTPANPTYVNDPLDRLPKPLATLLDSTLEHGWQPSEANDRLLAAAFATHWDESVEAAAKLPLGTVEDPRELTLNSPLRHLHSLTGADALLLTRGLRAQHDGDPERFVTDFKLVLNLSRNVRNKSVQASAAAGRRMERRAVQGLERWLERLHGRDDLLAEVATLLDEHDAACGNDAADVRLADQVVLRNTFRQSGEVFQRQWAAAERAEETRARMDVEIDLVGVAWRIPWEEERHERLIARGNTTGYGWGGEASPFDGLPGVGRIPHMQSAWFLTRGGLELAEGTTLADRRAARALVAIRRYQLNESKDGLPPATLSALVPKYLPAVPLDPFDKLPLRDRPSSAGDEIQMETRTMPPTTAIPLTDFGRELAELVGGVAAVDTDSRISQPPAVGLDAQWKKPVPPNSLILWSVGPDRQNGQGVRVSYRFINSDLVYVASPMRERGR